MCVVSLLRGLAALLCFRPHLSLDAFRVDAVAIPNPSVVAHLKHHAAGIDADKKTTAKRREFEESKQGQKDMQTISSAIAVGTFAAPPVNATYKRANGEAPLSQHKTESVLPALLRPQFIALSDDDLHGLERRVYYQDRAAQRNSCIAERAARASASARLAAEQRESRLRLRAARHAKAAGEVRVKEIQEEYRTIGMR
jgi:hypothetical protein